MRPNDRTETRKTKRLKTKPALFVMGLLLLGNLLWFVAWLIPNDAGSGEAVAEVDGDAIRHEDWVAEMESRVGRESLEALVNEKVMEAAAKKHDIDVSDEELELELALYRSATEGTDQTFLGLNEEQMTKKIRARIILEKVLAKDVVLEDQALKDYYEQNKSLYEVPTSYDVKAIFVSSQEEAESVKQELESGSSFEGLARERSIDASTASLGGSLGFINANTTSLDPNIVRAASELEPMELSEALPLTDGRFAVIQVQSVSKGTSFSFDDVKAHIQRELALEQLPQSVTPRAFWEEFDATWLYEDQS
ncbi:foldase [Tetzosporium hominis]|uniref:peptidylprolyl isomerase n=1 Tax=Tetzosporium hominis TaxID=2020506 RepID=A0A264W344_9BACL|nr:peptidyl-prolyl cis-trans isomerase [Tetzosporium hominis]OZS78028.1 foldase [Tetzosporium hominis]